MNFRGRVCDLMPGDRDFDAFGPQPPANRRPRSVGRERIGLFDRGLRISLKWQLGLQVSRHATVADSIRMKPVGNLAPPLRLHGEIALRGSDDTTRNASPPGVAQGSVTKTANFSRFAVDGAAMLAGFYHRSVLRCGFLAERNS